MMSNRNWDCKNEQLKKEIQSSRETIRYFEKFNHDFFQKNIDSIKKIEELEFHKEKMIDYFEAKFGISFEQAHELVENNANSNQEYNLEEYNQIINIIDEINGEKFFIYQRNKNIDSNKEAIFEMNNWIDKQKNNK